jgi:hypothetical protein
MLEFNTFNYTLDLGLGRSKKVAQDKGPFEIKYKKYERKFDTYLMVDGEFYTLRNPDNIVVELTNELPNGKLTVLTRGLKP